MSESHHNIEGRRLSPLQRNRGNSSKSGGRSHLGTLLAKLVKVVIVQLHKMPLPYRCERLQLQPISQCVSTRPGFQLQGKQKGQRLRYQATPYWYINWNLHPHTYECTVRLAIKNRGVYVYTYTETHLLLWYFGRAFFEAHTLRSHAYRPRCDNHYPMALAMDQSHCLT